MEHSNIIRSNLLLKEMTEINEIMQHTQNKVTTSFVAVFMAFYKHLPSHEVVLHFFGNPVCFEALFQTLN